MERLNKKECGELLKISKQRISQLVKSGALVFEADGKINKDDAIYQFNNTKSRATSKSNQFNTVVEDDSLTYWKTQTEKFKSQITEIDLKKSQGELLEAHDVKENARVLGKKLQDGLLAIPERISSILAVESDPLKIRQLILTEIKETLNQICNDLSKV